MWLRYLTFVLKATSMKTDGMTEGKTCTSLAPGAHLARIAFRKKTPRNDGTFFARGRLLTTRLGFARKGTDIGRCRVTLRDSFSEAYSPLATPCDDKIKVPGPERTDSSNAHNTMFAQGGFAENLPLHTILHQHRILPIFLLGLGRRDGRPHPQRQLPHRLLQSRRSTIPRRLPATTDPVHAIEPASRSGRRKPRDRITSLPRLLQNQRQPRHGPPGLHRHHERFVSHRARSADGVSGPRLHRARRAYSQPAAGQMQ